MNTLCILYAKCDQETSFSEIYSFVLKYFFVIGVAY